MSQSQKASSLMKIVWAAKRSIILYEILYSLTARLRHLIYYILLFGRIFTLLQFSAPIKNIIFWLVLAVSFSLFSQIYQDWFLNIYKPQALLELNSLINEILYKKAASVDLNCYESKDFYDNYTISISEANNRIQQLVSIIGNIISGSVMIIIYLYLVLVRDLYALCLTIMPLLSVFVFGKALNKAGYKLYQENIVPNRIKDYVKRTAYMNEYAKEYRVTNIFNVLKQYFDNSIKIIGANVKQYGKKIAILQICSNFFSNSFMLLSAVLYGSYLMMVPQTIQIGDFYILVSSIFNLLRILLEFSRNIIQLQGMTPYINNLITFMEYKNDIGNEVEPVIPDRTVKSICFRNVSFRYPNTERDVLNNINIEIKPNQKIAIVGYNGSGKTTLMKLLLRLYDVSDGTIEYNNNDIRDIDVNEYRQIFSVCFQDSKLFAMNVYENIVLDDVQNQNELADSAMKVSGILEKIEQNGGLKKAITKEFEEDGLVLSGGEQQKLALARVFAKNSGVVILDEPTSSLDPIAEEELFQNMLDVCINKTVIFISHRLSSAKIANKIFFMKDGKIVEEGTHADLIQKNGFYAEMFMAQAKGYQEGEH